MTVRFVQCSPIWRLSLSHSLARSFSGKLISRTESTTTFCLFTSKSNIETRINSRNTKAISISVRWVKIWIQWQSPAGFYFKKCTILINYRYNLSAHTRGRTHTHALPHSHLKTPPEFQLTRSIVGSAIGPMRSLSLSLFIQFDQSHRVEKWIFKFLLINFIINHWRFSFNRSQPKDHRLVDRNNFERRLDFIWLGAVDSTI